MTNAAIITEFAKKMEFANVSQVGMANFAVFLDAQIIASTVGNAKILTKFGGAFVNQDLLAKIAASLLRMNVRTTWTTMEVYRSFHFHCYSKKCNRKQT